MSRNLTPVAHSTPHAARTTHYGHQGAVIWLTGLSASGKSSLAMALETSLIEAGYSCFALDGDNIRHGLNSNLGFSPEDRAENIRRVGEVSALFADAGLICITAFISPYRADRQRARDACRKSFHEVYVAADLATCESRDPKGLYKKARAGAIADFTGIDAPYEAPETPELILDTANEPFETSAQRLLAYVTTQLPLKRK